jgi:S-adenosylmethionine:tRNA ribosyltransferase-isomerase
MHTERFVVSEETAARVDAARRVIAVGTTTVRVLESVADGGGRVPAGAGETNIFIRPPHEFRVVDALLTNFHFPESTLLMLVSAFADRELMLAAYEDAVRERYRFFSYGDCMLIL